MLNTCAPAAITRFVNCDETKYISTDNFLALFSACPRTFFSSKKVFGWICLHDKDVKVYSKGRTVLLEKLYMCSATLKGQCPDYAHVRASSVFSSKDNRTVILTRQDFLPDPTADGDLLLIQIEIDENR